MTENRTVVREEDGAEFGFCSNCIRVRWLETVDSRNEKGFPTGTCTQCAREAREAEGRTECDPHCVYPFRDHDGPCVDEPPCSDPRPDPATHPEYWNE